MKFLTIFCLVLFATHLAAADHAARTTKPNILLIVADDLGYGELGCYGGKDIPTPHIDSLAKSGVRFTDAYVTAPYCAASRAALLTGRYGTRFGFEFNPVGAGNEHPENGLPLSERTLADGLREAGYVTGLVGKWHLGGNAKFHPQRRGFDEFFGFFHEAHYFVPPPWAGHTTWLRRKALPNGSQGRWTSPDGRITWSTHMKSFEPDYDANNPVLRNSQPVDEQANLTDAFTREAVDFIKRHKEQPFFLYLAHLAVHSPMQGADVYMEKFSHIPDIHRRIFAAMLAHMDDGVGRVLETVRSEGLEENTIIIFLSDNGGPTREITSSNAPFRGEKGQLLEGGLRVPFIIQWKNRLPAGRVESRMASSLDLLPTALAAAGGTAPARLDGTDLLPFFEGDLAKPIRPRHYWRMGTPAALRAGSWKIYRDRDTTGWQLYDLANDPGETRNLADAHPERLNTLRSEWEALDKEMADPLWGPAGRRPRE